MSRTRTARIPIVSHVDKDILNAVGAIGEPMRLNRWEWSRKAVARNLERSLRENWASSKVRTRKLSDAVAGKESNTLKSSRSQITSTERETPAALSEDKTQRQGASL